MYANSAFCLTGNQKNSSKPMHQSKIHLANLVKLLQGSAFYNKAHYLSFNMKGYSSYFWKKLSKWLSIILPHIWTELGMDFFIYGRKFVKNGYVWPTQWPTSSELKIKFDPSLNRSWYEFFKIIKNHGPKNSSLSVIWIPSSQTHAGQLSEKEMMT